MNDTTAPSVRPIPRSTAPHRRATAAIVLGVMGVALHALLQAGERAILLRWRGRR